jgi:two-component system sensor histidine kinase YesM
MMVRRLYTKYFKRKLFNKIFLLYSLVIVISISVLSYSVVLNIKNSFENREREYNEHIINATGNYIKQKMNDSMNIIKQIYLDSSLHKELLYIMENGLDKHLEYKLNKLSSSAENTYMGFEAYFKSCIARDDDLLAISIYSAGKDEIYVYSRSSKIIYEPDVFVMNCLNGDASNIDDYKILPAHNVQYMDKEPGTKGYSIAYKIRDQFSPAVKGTLVMDFATEGIGKTVENYENSDKRNILLLTSKGDVIYDSSNRYYGKEHPYINNMKDYTDFTHKEETVICSNILSGYGIIAVSVIKNAFLAFNKDTR